MDPPMAVEESAEKPKILMRNGCLANEKTPVFSFAICVMISQLKLPHFPFVQGATQNEVEMQPLNVPNKGGVIHVEALFGRKEKRLASQTAAANICSSFIGWGDGEALDDAVHPLVPLVHDRCRPGGRRGHQTLLPPPFAIGGR